MLLVYAATVAWNLSLKRSKYLENYKRIHLKENEKDIYEKYLGKIDNVANILSYASYSINDFKEIINKDDIKYSYLNQIEKDLDKLNDILQVLLEDMKNGIPTDAIEARNKNKDLPF